MKKYTVIVLSAITLILSCVLCRFVLIPDMKQWPWVLFALGCVVIMISAILKRKHIPLFASLGYLIAFIIGAVFHTNGIDAGGGATDNLWIIWIIAYICSIAVGIIVDLILANRNR